MIALKCSNPAVDERSGAEGKCRPNPREDETLYLCLNP
jgi:hypothetical protein